MLAKVSTALAARNIPVVMATASESEVYVTVPQEKDGLEEGLDDVLKSLSAWAEVTVYRNKAQISIIGRGMIAFEGLGDKTISLSGKVYMVSLGTNLLSESFVIDRDRLQDTLEGLHNYIFKQS
jgi:aspartokinase